MRKGNFGIVFLITAALTLTACGHSVPEMSEEQNAQVVEYAAGLLLKYDENYDSRLVDDEHNRTQEQEPQGQETDTSGGQEEPAQEQADTMDAPQEPAQAEDPGAPATEVSDNGEEVPQRRSIEEFYGMDGIKIQYTGYELRDIYSGDDTDLESQDLAFAISASSGCKLLILHFAVTGQENEDVSMDMLSTGAKFKISINGAAPRYALTTMLTNDLSTYVGTIGAGTSVNLVLVGEIKTEASDSIETVSLMMKNVSEDATTLLN